jgi:hypothetical protein
MIKVIFLSEPLTEFFLDMLENENKPNPHLLDQLEDDEKSIIVEVCRLCECRDVIAGFGLKGQEDHEYKRFRLIQGSFVAGDNSPQVIKELKHYILKFLQDGRLSKRDGYSILAEIALLS